MLFQKHFIIWDTYLAIYLGQKSFPYIIISQNVFGTLGRWVQRDGTMLNYLRKWLHGQVCLDDFVCDFSDHLLHSCALWIFQRYFITLFYQKAHTSSSAPWYKLIWNITLEWIISHINCSGRTVWSLKSYCNITAS